MNTRIKMFNIGDLISTGEADIQTGPFGTQLKASEYVESGTPVINVRNVGFGEIRGADLEFISEIKTQKLQAHQLRKGDIVFGRKGAVERHALIADDQDGWIQGSDCLRLRFFSDRVCERFVSYYLRTQGHQDWMKALCSFGATMASLNQDIVKRITIPFPEFWIQRKIAAILTAYDDLIEVNKRRIALLEKMAEEIYREWFVRMRFPGHQETKFVKGVPVNWAIRELESLVSDIIDYRGLTPTKLGGHWEEDGIIALSALNVKSGELIRLNDSKKVSEQLYERWMRKELQSQDILLTSEAPLGQTYFLIETHRYVLSQRLFAIRADPAEVHPVYLYQYLRYPIGQGQLESRATGATVGGIRQALLKKIEVIVPNCELMAVHEQHVLPIFQEIHLLWKQNTNLRKTRDLLLPRLISGKLSVEDLDIQFPPSMQEDMAEAEAKHA